MVVKKIASPSYFSEAILRSGMGTIPSSLHYCWPL